MTPLTIEQVFIRPRSGGLEVMVVLENAAGRRERQALPLPVRDPRAALRQAALTLAARGARAAPRLRLRVERDRALRDDPELRAYFLTLLDEEEPQ